MAGEERQRDAGTVTSFNDAVEHVLNIEGGFQNRRSDPGNWTGGKVGRGRLVGTKHGISAASYPNEDIPNMTPERARYLYKRDYWDVIRGDELPYPLALVTVDAGINCGIGTAARWMQASLGVATDGKVGPITIAAAQRAPDVLKNAAGVCQRRILYSMQLDNWPENAEGWTQRILDVLRYAVEAA